MATGVDERYGERLGRVERATELPMLVLAYVPVFVVGYLGDVPPDVGGFDRRRLRG